METFDEDKKRILELLGLEVVEKRLNIHGGNDIVNLTKQFFQNVTEDVKAALVDLYKYDFAMFDYDPHVY